MFTPPKCSGHPTPRSDPVWGAGVQAYMRSLEPEILYRISARTLHYHGKWINCDAVYPPMPAAAHCRLGCSSWGYRVTAAQPARWNKLRSLSCCSPITNDISNELTIVCSSEQGIVTARYTAGFVIFISMRYRYHISVARGASCMHWILLCTV